MSQRHNSGNGSIPRVPTIDSVIRISRRRFLQCAAAAPLLGTIAQTGFSAESASKLAPRAVTSIALCKRYDYPQVRQTLAALFDELGDVRPLVRNKYVTVKLNLVNTSAESVGGVPVAYCVTVHPAVALAAGSLFVEYGAKQVTYCDQLPFRTPDPEAFSGYLYDFKEFSQTMDNRARFVNTRNAGESKNYALVKVPDGGYIANAWEVHKAYSDTDVLVSLAKLKSHVSAGVSLGMKNLYGVPPSSMYGDDIDNEPDENAIGYRGRTMHECSMKPLTSVDTFTGERRRGEHGFNVPRLIADLACAFPIGLVVVDGISVIQNGEGWWLGSIVSLATPGLLMAGRNPVCTDAVAAAGMGFNPEATDFEEPFANGSNHLALARQKGVGENRLKELEVGGIGLERAQFHYQPTYQRPRTS